MTSTLPAIKAPGNLPAPITQKIDFPRWADSLLNGVEYEDPDPDFMSRQFLIQTLSAETAEQVMKESGMISMQKMIPNLPGAGTGPIEITDIYVTGSDFAEGMPTYVLITATDLELGDSKKYVTGASQVQAQLLRLMSLGVWPIKCQIKRTDRKGKGENYLFWVTTVD